MHARVLGATPCGVDGLFVTVEVDRLRSQLPSVTIVGMADTAVREAKERVFAAIRNLGRKPEPANVVFNLAPADERKEGAGLDLPMAVAFLTVVGEIPAEAVADRLLIGELSLTGELHPVRGILPIMLAARARGVEEVIVPAANRREADVVEGVGVVACATLGEVVRWFRDRRPPAPSERGSQARRVRPSVDSADLSEVVGQEAAKRALEVAAAGGHHLLLMGPPGSGKSMLAKRLPGILPPLRPDEALETTSLYSVSTRVPRPEGLLERRPFRAPHHTISAAALIGGGSRPQPGEVSLAHNGVLFLDEVTEFRRDVLEGLRQPLEDRSVTVARARSTLSFPAGFQLIAAANPCPCGHLGNSEKQCLCLPTAIQRYRGRLSGPLLDRIDLQVMVPAVPWRALSATRRGEGSAVIAERIQKARSVQAKRFDGCVVRYNSEMSPSHIDRWVSLDSAGRQMLEGAARHLGLSARAYHRILRVARTIADLAGDDAVHASHLAEAVAYRALDREDQTAARTAAKW